jgi:hypothetical protein
MEESVRELGQQLGFVSSRPDNEFDKGPDVLWEEENSKLLLAFELKTDKDTPYNKDDVGQSLNHLNWVREAYPGHKLLGLILVGPEKGVTGNASPSAELFSIGAGHLVGLRDQFLGLVRDSHAQPPIYRLSHIEKATETGWCLKDLSLQLLRTCLAG